MTRSLVKCSILNNNDCLLGLYLIKICLEVTKLTIFYENEIKFIFKKFISRSKRYIPECIQFLTSVLYLAIDRNQTKSNLNAYQTSVILETFKRTKIDLVVNNSSVNELPDVPISIVNKNFKMNDELKYFYF
jgi:hypothetical protein